MENLTNHQLAKEWLLLDTPFAANIRYGIDKPDSVRYNLKNASILLTAPHAVRHARDGNTKDADMLTGGLIELLGQRTGASSLAASGYVQQWDTWVTRDDDFKTILKQEVLKGTRVLDIHGITDEHGVDICLGLGPRPSKQTLHLAYTMRAMLQPLKVSINVPYAAKKPYTVTAYVQSLGGNGLQIEITARLRDVVLNHIEATAFATQMSLMLQELIVTPIHTV